MLLIAVVLLSCALASVCDVAKNDVTTGLNYDCNNAGTCTPAEGFIPIRCKCCKPGVDYCGEDWICDKNNPFPECYYWAGKKCNEVQMSLFTNIGFRVELKDPKNPADITCSTVPEVRATSGTYGNPSMDFSPQINYLLNQDSYSGEVRISPLCDTCSVDYPCEMGINEGVNATKGTGYFFQVDFNTFYNRSCESDQFYGGIDDYEECSANYDFGGRANNLYNAAKGTQDAFLAELNKLLSAQPSDENSNMGLGWTNSDLVGFREVATKNTRTVLITYVPSAAPTSAPTFDPTTPPTVSPSAAPTSAPTFDPTITPTVSPTVSPTDSECGPYTNDVADFSPRTDAENCRGGLDDSYPGGQTCDSPYLICLPQENTPAAFDGQDYKSSTHSYSVDECKQECANDQRCNGIEWDTSGNCTLIDDIPVVPSIGENSNDRECYVKENHCNPYFEADDLTDVMLTCYCPNNRKGFYTKKVKRTLNNTRFCGNDAAVDTRVKKAQANRMFHLCENWCLFNTDSPMTEAFYWDPWKACFREQNMDTGVHMSYCNRVIRSPGTIEMQFINNRVNLTCKK